MYICVNVYMYICIHVGMSICIYVDMCICIYVDMYIYMYICKDSYDRDADESSNAAAELRAASRRLTKFGSDRRRNSRCSLKITTPADLKFMRLTLWQSNIAIENCHL